MANLFINHLKHIFFSFFTTKKTLIAHSEKYDLRFKFHIKDGVGRDIYYKKGVYSEDYITQFLLKEIGIHDNDLVIDIGANIGWYSLVLSSGSKPQVISFEPDPFNFSLLQDNINLNKKDNIQAFNKAVSDQPGVMTLYVYKSYNLGRHSAIRQRNSIGSEEVETIQLDSFLENRGLADKKIRLIKIDIEGYEFAAMSGAQEALKRADYLMTEFSPAMMKELNHEPMDYIKLITDSGLDPWIIDEKGLSKPDYAAIIGSGIQVNLFCRRN